MIKPIIGLCFPGDGKLWLPPLIVAKKSAKASLARGATSVQWQTMPFLSQCGADGGTRTRMDIFLSQEF
jgi:hypothetical protein